VPDLSPRERQVLSALLAAEGPVTNKELAAGGGIRLTGAERRRLNELRLVTSARRGRGFVHELSPAGAEALITTAYRALAPGPGEFVGLRELREQLPAACSAGAGRSRVDAALKELYAAQRINLVPRSNQRALSPGDREAAIRLGGEHKHMISIER
jgi:hypothetical protein